MENRMSTKIHVSVQVLIFKEILPQCSVFWIIFIKTFNAIDSISSQALAANFDFTSFSTKAVLATIFYIHGAFY